MISTLVRRIEFLTADGYSPFTGRAIEGGGMLTEVISSAMGIVKHESRGRFDFGISWVNDWAAHLNPLLLTRAFDVGFPWLALIATAGSISMRLHSSAAGDSSSPIRCTK